MGVAQGFNLEFEAATGSLHDAITVLEKRIENLKSETESQGNINGCLDCLTMKANFWSPPDPMRKPDAFYTREKEISEIEAIVPEIKEKIADTRDMQNETLKKLGDRALLGDDTVKLRTSDNSGQYAY